MTSKENRIAEALSIVGILSILSGIILGLYYGTSDSFFMPGYLQGMTGMFLFINGVVWGIIFFGFSEIIKLLQGIFNQGETVPAKADQPQSGQAVRESAEITEKRKEQRANTPAYKEIRNFYADNGRDVQAVKGTKVEDFYIVTVDGAEEVIELGGFKPIVVSRERAELLGLLKDK